MTLASTFGGRSPPATKTLCVIWPTLSREAGRDFTEAIVRFDSGLGNSFSPAMVCLPSLAKAFQGCCTGHHRRDRRAWQGDALGAAQLAGAPPHLASPDPRYAWLSHP